MTNQDPDTMFTIGTQYFEQGSGLTKREKKVSEGKTQDKSNSYFSRRYKKIQKSKPVKDLYFAHR